MSFGRHMLKEWPLDPATTYLNHGTVGSPPRRVLAKQQAIRDEIERQPSQFLLRELAYMAGETMPRQPRLRAAADVVAGFVGAKGMDFAFVDNATTGMNAVLRSLDLKKGDEILITDLAYGAIANVARFTASDRGATVRTVELPYPVYEPGDIIASVVSAINPQTRIVLIDHITSETALVLPVAEIVDFCRKKKIAVAIDGAHAPGAIVLDIPLLGADWYVANLHKWAYSPRSCGFLWAAVDRQDGLHPPVISWGLGKGFISEFDWVGTRDPSAHLAAPEGIAFMRELGVDAVRKYNHNLAWEGALLLSKTWGTKLGMSEQMVGTMATVPLPERLGSTKEEARKLRAELLKEDGIEIQMHAWRNRLWVRLSAQIYNEMSDVEQLSAAVAARI